MVEINDNNRDVERQEDKRNEEKKLQTRRDIERKMQTEGMKSFEAKLSEKTAHELEAKQSNLTKQKGDNKAREEKLNILEKIIGAKQDKEVDQGRQRVAAMAKSQERAADQAKSEEKYESILEREEEAHDDTEVDDKKSAKTNDSSDSGGVAEEGHKRVHERNEDQGGHGGQSFGGNQSHSGDSGSGTSGGDSGSSDGKDFSATMVAGVRGIKSGSGGRGFQRNSRQFTRENLDEIVTAVQIGMNEQGEEEFSVELSDNYFAGLKVTATRTEEGIVVRFVCPDVATRSTFLKFRPTVYAHFKSKGIKVFRIDVV